MSQSSPQTSSLIDRLMVEVKHNPTKALVLGSLMLVLLVMVGYQVQKALRPAKASAASGTVDRPGGGRNTRSQRGDDAKARIASVGEPAQKDPLVFDRSQRVVDRDLFTPDPTYYPRKEQAKPAPKVTPVDDKAAKREAEVRAVQTQARALALQSTIVSAVPTAIINGQVLRAGEEIAGFSVVSIGSRSCVIEKSGLRVTLEMSN